MLKVADQPSTDSLPRNFKRTGVAWAASSYNAFATETFSPRCMQCRRDLAMRIMSVRPSVCLSVRLSVKRVHCDKRKKDLSRFLYLTKGHLAYSFLRRRIVGGGHRRCSSGAWGGGAKPPKFFPTFVDVYWKQVIKKYKKDSRKHA